MGKGRRTASPSTASSSKSRKSRFEKLRKDLFKEANELATLCAVQIAIIVFSPEGKLHTYGSPDVDSVIQRYLNLESSSRNHNYASQGERIEKFFYGHIYSRIKDLVCLGKSPQEIASLVKPPKGLTLDEHEEMNRRIVQLISDIFDEPEQRKQASSSGSVP